ncbi:MAG TPA: BON domain-containing protein [Polyangiaceae bacterium]
MKPHLRTSSTFVALLALFAAPACHKSQTAAKPEPGAVPSAAAQNAPSSTNSTVQSAVTAELRKDQRIDRSALSVQAKDGIVTLTGKVDNAFSKERATRVAEVVRGVRTVDNRLEVVPEKRPDADVERDVGKALTYNAATAKMPVRAQVRNGVVTLTGTVRSWQEQQLAERIADAVRGVRFTQNDLTTKQAGTRKDSAIAGDVKSRLAWDVLVEHDPIAADVKGAKVTLSGAVGSAAEKRRAENDAWVDGATNVDAGQLRVNVASRPDKNLQSGAPKSDGAIALAIKTAALYDPRVNAFNLNPSVHDGVVTLSGTVDTLNAKLTAEALARNTVGVKDVKNEIVARSQEPVADRLLEDRVRSALLFDPLADAHDIFASVKDGQVKLTGTVGTFFEKAEAFDVASRIAGVTAVGNEIKVSEQLVPYVYSEFIDPYLPYVQNWYAVALQPSGSDADIRNRIESEIAWSSFVEPADVRVSVSNGKATLSGTVGSWREREAAVQCALEAGAVSIDNELKVS